MDAADFMALLRASNPVWHDSDPDSDPQRWVFRGHRDARWRLKPRAWRTAAEGNPVHPMIDKLATAPVHDDPEVESGTPLHRGLAWTHAEKIVLNEFRRIGWHMGFDVAEPSSTWSMDLKYGPKVIDDTRLSGDCYSPFLTADDIGIAQHYGVPTRFLDWTFNPIFAVFFAQEDHAPTLENIDLCVWALDLNAIENMLLSEGGISRCILRSILPRRRGNDFILAQDGLLIEIEHKWALEFFAEHGAWPAIEEVVVALNNEQEYNADDPTAYIYDVDHPMLRRIVLPASEIPELRIMLEREGITREKLMPTLENAARSAIRAVSKS
jgi:FRG domain-containing protein